MAAPLPPSNSNPEPISSPPETETLNRRESDRGGDETGIRSGGRRTSDRRPLARQSKWVTYAIIGSFVFSGGVLTWAFTLPFRHANRPVTVDSVTTGADDRHPEASMTNEQFVAMMVREEQELKTKLQRKYEPPRNLPDLSDSKRHWEESRQRKERMVKKLLANVEGVPEEGSLEWETAKQLEAVLEDAPPERYRNR
ncbi:hypothetical protein [Stieleria varia]|uniref:Transmembrane protein n=1 Tax=Stieleria varia TaxID=2528005 RepID=A0A5C6B244_9BACT|nr:hypothetical protein [Stieleria varia]TWU05641.1 hypothetical protein Pla52n_13560 [Stieleria varia]